MAHTNGSIEIFVPNSSIERFAAVTIRIS